MTLVKKFWTDLKDILFHPARFFSANAKKLLSDEGLSSALTFAVIVQWLASFFNFLWGSTVGMMMQTRVDDLLRIAGDVVQTGPGAMESLEEFRSSAIEFLFGAGAIILTPFTTILKLLVVGLLVHAAVRFFMRDEPGRQHRYSTTLKILAYASAPWILCVLPVFGMILAYVLVFAAGVIGLREVYRTTSFRAALAMAFPELLVIGFAFGGLILFLFLAFNVLRLVF